MKIDRKAMERIDSTNMLDKLAGLPEQLRQGWKIAAEAGVRINPKEHDAVVFCGMGGSAISGDLLRVLAGPELKFPFLVNRDYILPPLASRNSFCIISSYSGNTEETLSSLSEARQMGCPFVAITSGGKVGDIARESKAGLAVLPGGYPPRAALGFSLGALLAMVAGAMPGTVSKEALFSVCDRLEALQETWKDPESNDNLPLQVAERVAGHLPLIYAYNQIEAVGQRWKTQFNENADTHAYAQALSELNHNEIVGWQELPDTKGFFSRLQAILLRTSRDHERIQLRMDITKEVIEKSGGSLQEIRARGDSFLEEVLYLVYLGDLMSYYLAIMYRVDPVRIENIDYLKAEMSKRTIS